MCIRTVTLTSSTPPTKEALACGIATVCHQVGRHNGDPVKFWSGPFQSLCSTHHDVAEQREEDRGFIVGNDSDGRHMRCGSKIGTVKSLW